ALGLSLSEGTTHLTDAPNLIASQGFLHDSDERAIARKEDAVQFTLLRVLRGDVEANECLACTRDTRHEADGLCPAGAAVADNLLDGARRGREVLDASVTPRDLCDAMSGVERHCGLDNCGGRLVSTCFPFFRANLFWS